MTKRGNNDVGSGFNDDPAWLVLAVAAYLKETGDWGILDTQVQYENEDGSERPLYLKRLRRKAGGVRDIDVQIAALRKLKIGRELERKARLMQALNEQRSQREQGLAKALADKDVQKVRKALHRWSAGISSAKPGVPAAPTGMGKYDEVAASLRRFASLARQVRTLTPENLHAYRTRCKRIRYVAEMAGNVPEAKRIVGQLKRMQDVEGALAQKPVPQMPVNFVDALLEFFGGNVAIRTRQF